jgi:hypothetical protein
MTIGLAYNEDVDSWILKIICSQVYVFYVLYIYLFTYHSLIMLIYVAFSCTYVIDFNI